MAEYSEKWNMDLLSSRYGVRSEMVLRLSFLLGYRSIIELFLFWTKLFGESGSKEEYFYKNEPHYYEKGKEGIRHG